MLAEGLSEATDPSDQIDAFTDERKNLNVPSRVLILLEDLLVMIFQEFVTEQQPLPWPENRYSSERATGPFVLAAVSRNWRDIALNCPTIWNYFGFPGWLESPSLLELRVERSKDAPIDIFWRPHSLTIKGDAFKFFMRLCSLCYRWRSVDISFPYADKSVHRLECLSRSMPFLRSFALQSQVTGRDGDLALGEVFCDAPFLRHLFVDNLAEGWKFADTRPPSLTELALWPYNWQIQSLIALLAHVSSTLEILALYEKSYEPQDSDADCSVTLPKVTSITLHRPKWLQNIHVPGLRHLAFWGGRTGRSPIPYLSPYHSVQSLGFWGNLSHLYAFNDVLRVFDAVTCVRIAVPPGSYRIFGSETCSVGKGVLRRIVDDEMPLWPALQVLEFGNDGYHGREEMDLDLDDLEFIVRHSDRLGAARNPIKIKAASSLTQELQSALARLNQPP